MNILALDLGTRCGWALIKREHVESGVQDFSLRRGESPGMRYLHFRRWLERIAPRDLIVYELPHLRGGAAATLLVGFQTRVEEFCAERKIEWAGVHSATLKKFATGSGRGDKGAMFRAALAKGWITEPRPDDEVDAVCLLHYALAELAPVGDP